MRFLAPFTSSSLFLGSPDSHNPPHFLLDLSQFTTAARALLILIIENGAAEINCTPFLTF